MRESVGDSGCAGRAAILGRDREEVGRRIAGRRHLTSDLTRIPGRAEQPSGDLGHRRRRHELCDCFDICRREAARAGRADRCAVYANQRTRLVNVWLSASNQKCADRCRDDEDEEEPLPPPERGDVRPHVLGAAYLRHLAAPDRGLMVCSCDIAAPCCSYTIGILLPCPKPRPGRLISPGPPVWAGSREPWPALFGAGRPREG